MAVNTAITFLHPMKIHYLIESERESAHREAVVADKLYRGVSEKIPEHTIIRVPIRQDRVPRDSSFWGHIIFCAAFEKAIGIPDVRAKALFCTTDYGVAVDYGEDVVSVYPLKAARLAYMPRCPDSGSFVSSLYYQFWGQMAEAFVTTDHAVSTRLVKLLGDDVPFLETQNPLNCATQLREFIMVLDKAKPGLTAIMTNLLQQMAQQMAQYVVVPSSEIHTIPDGVEVMVIESPYYYAEIAANPWRDE